MCQPAVPVEHICVGGPLDGQTRKVVTHLGPWFERDPSDSPHEVTYILATIGSYPSLHVLIHAGHVFRSPATCNHVRTHGSWFDMRRNSAVAWCAVCNSMVPKEKPDAQDPRSPDRP